MQMPKTPDLTGNASHTMGHLESKKRTTESGIEYWLARDIRVILGYDTWENFESVVGRAEKAMASDGRNPSHHIRETTNMMRVGKGAQRCVRDYFLTRAACYLVAMNGEPSKPEIAAAQTYFATQTRAREIELQVSEDEKRIQMRDKVSKSAKVVSGVAKDAGVRNQAQSRFHGARWDGLYEMSMKDAKSLKGIGEKETPFDRMSALELSANDFQMNLAAETIRKEDIRGEYEAIEKNRAVAKQVRQTMIDSGSRTPEQIPAEEHIKETRKRVKLLKKQQLSKNLPIASPPPS